MTGAMTDNQFHLTLDIPGLPTGMNKGSRNHWRYIHAERTKWKQAVAFCVSNRRPPRPLKKASLHCTRYSSVSPDSDNLVSSFKSIIDGLVFCGVLLDDKWENIGMPHYEWQRAPQKQGHIRVILTAEMTDMATAEEASDVARRRLRRRGKQTKI